MEAEYRHTQFGTLTIIILLVVGILLSPIILSLITEGRGLLILSMVVLYLLTLTFFYAFTVEISEGRVKWWFGIGAIRKSYLLKEIQATKEVKNPWYYLWGIKSIPGGWLYAIAPGSAVELVFKDGRVVRLGTNRPEELRKAIEDSITAR